MRTFIKTALFSLVLAAASQASAVIVTDFVDIHEVYDGYLLISQGESYTITHDLTDNGVPTENEVDSATLKLEFADDNDRFWFEGEFSLVTGEGIFGFFEVDGNIWNYDVEWLGVGTDGINDLNNNGQLAVTVTSLDWIGGDFWWKTSTLFANINPVEVNEPATLVILGIGLLGLGFVRRRKIS